MSMHVCVCAWVRIGESQEDEGEEEERPEAKCYNMECQATRVRRRT